MVGKELLEQSATQTKKQEPCREMLHEGHGRIRLEKNPIAFGDEEIGS